MYVPLRVHGHHSMLTGVDAPRVLVERARALGITALALCDVDTLSGIVDFLHATRRVSENGTSVRPIVGVEISDPSGKPGRVVALVENERGWKSLCKLTSARQLGADPGVVGAVLEGPDHFDLVQQATLHRDGLIFLVDHPRLAIALAGRIDARSLFVAISPASVRMKSVRRERDDIPRNVARAPRSAGIDAASREARDLEDAPRDGEEVLDTPKVSAPERPVAASDLIEAARAVGLATVAVSDVYGAFPKTLADHRVRVAIKHNALLADLPDTFTAHAPAHLLSSGEMRSFYASIAECAGPFEPREDGALARSIDIAERCTFTPALGGILFPQIELATDETAYSRLVALSFRGASERYRPLKPEAVRRLDYELSTIDKLGFAPYFLLVLQIADFARAQGIPYVGRGSAADSLVAYCLRLTDADPLRYKLIFERFLNPSRLDRPDIDLDFCWRRRDEVLDHVYGMFGTERTAMIATIATCGVRAAFREAALVEGVPPAEVNRWSRRLPYYFDASAEVAHGQNPIERCLRETPEASGFPFDDPRMQRVVTSAARLVSAPRHYGLHPGGVVVAPGPITDFVSCQRATKGCIVTQFDKDAVEAIGLVKMDLLGNRALTVVDDCVKALSARGITVDVETLREDDARTAETLQKGLTLGCFQVESPGMRHLLQQIGACDMDDVIQAVALIRPGPAGSGMKDAYVRRYRELEPPTPPHPRLVEVLWDTYGVLLYQEDVMQVAARLAGMDLAEADSLRRALQKHRAHDLKALCDRFVSGCIEQGVAREDALRAWDLVANFASFGFCKAHAVTYGRIAYRAVWLKTHHPAEYLAAFLASDTGYYATRVYVEEARRMGVPILPPDVNKSERAFRVERGALRVGLAHVKGVQARTLDALFAARASDGPFISLPDFLERTQAHTDECERLIQVGALDAFDRTIPELLWRLHLLRAPERKAPRAKEGENSLNQEILAACRATPRSRDAVRVAREQSQGWTGKGIGLGAADLAPGETAALFPEREAPALALPRLSDVSLSVRGRVEHELLGLTVKAHPTTLFPCPADARIEGRDAIAKRTIGCAEIVNFLGARVTLRGWPAATRHVRTSDGRTMRFLTLEDETGLAECVVFPDVYERDGAHLAEFGTLCFSGVVQNQMGACTLHVEIVH
ncbi:MAG: DNA polymerase III subunit alpha [Planctomycetota bacterium]|nr:DNA polymerase III subunit alpha [Planctomycetota bacterium]